MPFSVGIVFFQTLPFGIVGIVVVLQRLPPRALLNQVFAMWQCDCQHVMCWNREMARNNINHCCNRKEEELELGKL